MNEAACRKLVSRARRNIEHGRIHHATPTETQDRLLRAFQSAVMSGSTVQLARLLSSDIRLTTDSGGKAVAALRVLEGDEVLNVLSRAQVWWERCTWKIIDMNGGRGAILIETPPEVSWLRRRGSRSLGALPGLSQAIPKFPYAGVVRERLSPSKVID
jgi:hypothetical protein